MNERDNLDTLIRLMLVRFFPELKTREMWVEREYARTFDLSWSHVPDTLPRVDVKRVSPEEFIEKYEKPYLPCVLTGVQDTWMAREKWTLEVGRMKRS